MSEGRPVRNEGNGESSLQWLSPDEFLLIVPTGEKLGAEQRLREALDSQHIAVINVSKSQLGQMYPMCLDAVPSLHLQSFDPKHVRASSC